jgi:hypothetical protein
MVGVKLKISCTRPNIFSSMKASRETCSAPTVRELISCRELRSTSSNSSVCPISNELSSPPAGDYLAVNMLGGVLNGGIDGKEGFLAKTKTAQ